MNLSKNKILILGGKPIGSVDIVNYAKEKGCYTIVCDYLPFSQSPAKQIADEYWDYSTADIDLIVQKAKKEKVSAVFTGVHEFNIEKCQNICKKLNLPFYADAQKLEITSNKRIYKDIFKKFEIPVIDEYKITNINTIQDDIEYPVLIKPADGSGAYGLQICHSKKEIISKLGNALNYSCKKEIIAEKYIENKEEITIVYIIKDGFPYLASAADRIVKHFDNSVIPLPVQYIWNSKYLNLYEKTTDKKMKEAIRYMNLKNGMLFIQSIVKNNVIMPYDIGFRLSGTQEHLIIEKLCGYNPLKLLTDYSLTGVFGDEKLIKKINPHFQSSAAQITFLAKPAVIGHFEGIEEVSKMRDVIRIIKNKQEGEEIPQNALGTLNQVVLRVFIYAPDKKELIEKSKVIRKKIKVFDINGSNILYD